MPRSYPYLSSFSFCWVSMAICLISSLIRASIRSVSILSIPWASNRGVEWVDYRKRGVISQMEDGSFTLCCESIFSKQVSNRRSSSTVRFFGPFVRPPLLRNLALISRSSSRNSILSDRNSRPAGLKHRAPFPVTRAASPQSWVTTISPDPVELMIFRSAS